MVTTVRKKLVELVFSPSSYFNLNNVLNLPFRFTHKHALPCYIFYLVVGYDLPPVVFLFTETLVRHRRQFLVLSQLVSQSIKGSYFWCLRLKLDHLGRPATRLLLGAVLRLRVELSQHVIDLAARSLDWV